MLKAALCLLLLSVSALAQQQVPINSGSVVIPVSASATSFRVVLNQNVTSFSISGFGESLSGIAESPKVLFNTAGYNLIDNVGFYSFGARATSGMTVLFNSVTNHITNSEFDGFGTLFNESSGGLGGLGGG